jgi:putative lipoprotein
MSIRSLWVLPVLLALSACSHMPWHHEAEPPVRQSLMKSLSGIVSFDVAQPLPAGAYLQVTLSDVSRQDAPARSIAEDRIEPVGASPVEFHLNYDPAKLKPGVDFAVSARLQHGDELLAINDERVTVLAQSGEQEPVKVVLKTVSPAH